MQPFAILQPTLVLTYSALAPTSLGVKYASLQLRLAELVVTYHQL
jgi:hypothetical protein